VVAHAHRGHGVDHHAELSDLARKYFGRDRASRATILPVAAKGKPPLLLTAPPDQSESVGRLHLLRRPSFGHGGARRLFRLVLLALARLFYPDTKRTDTWFRHYTENFRTVELNAPFYSWPKLATAQKLGA
jgi:hypothetical protein